MARILILREAEAGRRTAATVAAGGDTPILLPAHRIVPLAPPRPEGAFAAVLVTSANAVPYLAALAHAAPILAVGSATAAYMVAAGLAVHATGEGGGAGLAATARTLHEASGRPLLYLAGRVRTDGLEATLTEAGVPVSTLEVYDTVAIAPEADDVARAFADGPADAALVLSLGQAAALSALHNAYGDSVPARLRALCLSARIAEALPLTLRRSALVAERPELSLLLCIYRRTVPNAP